MEYFIWFFGSMSYVDGGQFWEKGGYTLDDTRRGESHMGVRQFLRGYLTIEDTMEKYH